MDNEQRSAGLRADLRVALVVNGAEIVKQMPAGSECDRGYFGAPGIDTAKGEILARLWAMSLQTSSNRSKKGCVAIPPPA